MYTGDPWQACCQHWRPRDVAVPSNEALELGQPELTKSIDVPQTTQTNSESKPTATTTTGS